MNKTVLGATARAMSEWFLGKFRPVCSRCSFQDTLGKGIILPWWNHRYQVWDITIWCGECHWYRRNTLGAWLAQAKGGE